MPTKKMGFEGLLYYGPAGTIASQAVTLSRDITETFDIEEGPTTVKGAGSVAPLETTRVTGRKYSVEFQTIYKSDDTIVLAMLAAAVAGTPVAIRTKAHTTGLGYDGDMNLKWKWGKPLKGEQTVDFTGTPNDDERAPLLNV